jgi:hypothetical protein
MVFYSLFGVVYDEIWGMIKTTALYQLPEYKTLELVVESEPTTTTTCICYCSRRGKHGKLGLVHAVIVDISLF